MSHQEELQRLQAENSCLKSLLLKHGIEWEEKTAPPEPPSITTLPSSNILTPEQKIQLFMKLFRGRRDVFPLRWESAKGKSGYSPLCAHEWVRGKCAKPKIKCSDCEHRKLVPATEKAVYNHLIGKHCMGVYPLLPDDTCYFLAVDFDEADWQKDVQAIKESCVTFQIPAAMEISRSGKGAHLWIFFSEAVPASIARKLGTALISHACRNLRQLSLQSYDRLFPNQDTMPKGGFGNLIALPLQKTPRSQGYSVFVDDNFMPYENQWDFLASITKLTSQELNDKCQQICKENHPLDIHHEIKTFYNKEEHIQEPWKPAPPVQKISFAPLATPLQMVRADRIYIAKDHLPQAVFNTIIRLAAFPNPEFYKAQAMRLPVWNKPRIIACADILPKHIALPRGCLEALVEFLQEHHIEFYLQDECVTGKKIRTKFVGKLKKEQTTAIKALMMHDIGVLHAPTGFGKTVMGAAMIAKRKVSTLILVHRTELLQQWQERLTEFLEFPLSKNAKNDEKVPKVGLLGGSKKKVSGHIDIALLQTLVRHKDLANFLQGYGQIIVDECHHISAFSFESVLKEAKAKYVLGLTATPIRRDGHHPIITMQCGGIRHSATMPKGNIVYFTVHAQNLNHVSFDESDSIQEIFRKITENSERNSAIIQDALKVYNEGRKILLLTERTEHLQHLFALLEGKVEHLFMLHGRLPKKQRTATMQSLKDLAPSSPRILLATGKLIGEGFDHSPLDTLFLAMPISWRGTLQQYAGRLHRDHAGKQDVKIYDYVDKGHAILERMWQRRIQGYKRIGYTMEER